MTLLPLVLAGLVGAGQAVDEFRPAPPRHAVAVVIPSRSAHPNDREVQIALDTADRLTGMLAELGLAPEVIEGELWVPLRFTAEALGYTIKWEPGPRIAWIR